MTSKLTREERVQSLYGLKIGQVLNQSDIESIKILARMALAALDSEPVALQPELAKVIYHFRDWNEGFPVERFKADYVISWMLANYPPVQPAKDREQVRREHAEWSQATFGNVGPVGPLKHLSKEALEAAAEPGDLSEWADMQFLLWDAQRRAGITDEQITQAMIEKLAVNKQREWPAPKDGEPRLHIKEWPVPVVPDGYVMVPKELTCEMDDAAWEAYHNTRCMSDIWDALLSLAPQLPGSEPATVPGKWIPVSEKLPERGDWLVTDGCDFDVQLFNGEQFIPGFVWEDKITHWMPLPTAPQEEAK